MENLTDGAGDLQEYRSYTSADRISDTLDELLTHSHADSHSCVAGPRPPEPQSALDNSARSEASSGAANGAISVVRVSIRLVEGEAGDAAARAQSEALMEIARRLGLVEEKEVK